MRYDDFAEWMFGLERFGIKLGLDNTKEFLGRLGNPERSFKSIHVAGTNGKGSVCAIAAEVLRAHGLKVGLYTSPHLVDFRERIRINNRRISEREVIKIGLEQREVMQAMASESMEKQLTFFEFTTGLAFKYFEEKGVDIVVAEVGMGGRLDATNVLVPEVSVITRIGLEHTNYLGGTIPEIAREKAGIIKEGVRAVTCERKPEALTVIENTCIKKRAPLRRIGKDFDISSVRQTLRGIEFDYRGKRTLRGLRTGLLGSHQAENAAVAIAAIEELGARDIAVTDEEIKKGLSSVKWPGRLDVISRRPLVILDGSHNPDGVATTAIVLRSLGLQPLTFVIGCMDDKDARGIVRALIPLASKMIVTQAGYKRALPADSLLRVVQAEFSGETVLQSDARSAFEHGFRNIKGKGLCVIGSLYVVGEAVEWWSERRGPARSAGA
ncbi:MAG: bifunctional folylpolyglutamate synthase/dihydrofolate synthase [Candidatus Thermoplasmatota archaeon]|nr:bifunctional folylpolyglutamate synthase/dihydrofolate synthase [Candidatus Thermoplasmatota archaeon]